MMKLEIEVGIDNIEQSNKFLRKLWSLFNEEFGKCSWQYSPFKIGKYQQIYFGMADIKDYNLEISILYKNKGSITKIIFESSDGDKLDEKMRETLKKLVKYAKENYDEKEAFFFKGSIISNYVFSNYETQCQSMQIFGLKNKSSNLVFSVSAYDHNQASGKAIEFINEALDFLSIETNLMFYLEEINVIENAKFKEKDEMTYNKKESYQDNSDFIEGYSTNNKQIVISKEAIQFLKYIQKNDNEDIRAFMRACHHFHSARKLDSDTFEVNSLHKKTNTRLDSNLEIANTLYLSALEVVSSIGFQSDRCSECNQLKYSISKRVKDITNKYLNDNVAKEVVKSYSLRSKYLHEGVLIRNTSPTIQSIPLLDNSTKSGCKENFPASIYNLREYTSYILRRFYREFFDL
ncbi:Uncharacterised protein [Staphylococcus auricularis]|nr:Uncharacterised protein [Staphylococcus auricularis]